MPNVRARQLRSDMTEAERRLWSLLRDRRLTGYKFRRQRPLGPFIVDFVCMEHRLVIEVDGGQHADNEADTRRTAWLEAEGWHVIRFWNNEVLSNSDGVAERVLRVLMGKDDEAE
jgi:very-short-patch-repair endonuclease